LGAGSEYVLPVRSAERLEKCRRWLRCTTGTLFALNVVENRVFTLIEHKPKMYYGLDALAMARRIMPSLPGFTVTDFALVIGFMAFL
jgi:hypothetical protein